MNLEDVPLDLDPRWNRVHGRRWNCRSCGGVHDGLFDLACGKPEQWPGDEDAWQHNSVALESTHFLAEDFCVLNDEHFFVRSVLRIPLLGAGPDIYFGYGVWSTLSRKNFEIYRDGFDGGDYEGFGPWFGWFSNRLAIYPDTLNLKCQVHPRNGRQRPLIGLEQTDHPLALEQRNGITFDRLLEIYAGFGHDIRASLLD